MPRIPEADIERLKDEVSVQRLVEASGVALKKAGKDFVGRCPFHADDTASLVVTPAKNLWHCFGCGVGGGPIDWVMRQQGVSFRHAVELLREGVVGAGDPVRRSTARALPAPVAFDADDQALLDQTVAYYHERLLGNAQAQGYLRARGLDHPELISTFKLGVADRTLGLRLPEKNRKAGAEIRARLAKVGLYRESGHEHFNGSLIVPVMDESGHVVEIYGRKLLDNLRAGTPKHLYLPAQAGRSRGVFNLAAFTHADIILCEALIDALTFWVAGYRNVTASYGIEGFTEEHVAAFKRHGTERVLIAYDRDEAGERGAAKVAERLLAEGIECLRVQFPKGMDANEYALKVQPAAKSLGLLLNKALWLGKGQAAARVEVVPVAEPAPVSAPSLPVPSLAAKEEPLALTVPMGAVPAPAKLALAVTETEQGRQATMTVGEGATQRSYRVRGLPQRPAVDALKINLMLQVGERFYVDTLDLYSAKHRANYVTQAVLETRLDERLLKADLGRLLLQLEQLPVDTPKLPDPVQDMDGEASAAALAFLRAPDLIERILADFNTCGLVGEDTNKLVGYLAVLSRKLARPLGIVIQSTSAAGKTSLMDAVLAFVPEEDKVKYSAMTGQALFYMGETNLKNKALAVVEEEGASRASYALKLLQSEGELTIASTGKDPQSGNLVTQQYRVEGPVALLLTTTARDLDEELMNRCLVLAVDEGRAQTRAIHQLQRDKRTLEGLLAQHERADCIALHQNAQRLLRPLAVFNPYAHQLTFPDQATRLRRDHEKYLTLIDTIALLHQHQRPVKRLERGQTVLEYIEVTLEDIALATRLAHDVLGRSLDELPPQTRRLLQLIDQYVQAQSVQSEIDRTAVRFSRRGLREAIGWGDTQLRLHLERLVELEYVLTHREGAGGKYVYELVYEVDADRSHASVAGLVEIDALRAVIEPEDTATVSKSRGEGDEVAPRLRGGCGPIAAPLRGHLTALQEAVSPLTSH